MKKVTLYYADWCGHCNDFKPVWGELKKVFDKNDIKYEEYEDSKDEDIIGANNVSAYPTIHIENGPVKYEYKGGRDADSILREVVDLEQMGGSNNNTISLEFVGGSTDLKFIEDDEYEAEVRNGIEQEILGLVFNNMVLELKEYIKKGAIFYKLVPTENGWVREEVDIQELLDNKYKDDKNINTIKEYDLGNIKIKAPLLYRLGNLNYEFPEVVDEQVVETGNNPLDEQVVETGDQPLEVSSEQFASEESPKPTIESLEDQLEGEKLMLDNDISNLRTKLKSKIVERDDIQSKLNELNQAEINEESIKENTELINGNVNNINKLNEQITELEKRITDLEVIPQSTPSESNTTTKMFGSGNRYRFLINYSYNF